MTADKIAAIYGPGVAGEDLTFKFGVRCSEMILLM